MKILHTSKIIGIAGSENYLLNILPELVNKNVEIEFLSLVPLSSKGSEVVFNNKLIENNVKVHTVYYTKSTIFSLKKIKKKIEDINPDIIHSHLIHADFTMAMVKKYFLPKIKLVSTKHGYEESYNNQYGFDPSHRKKDKYWRIASFSEKQVNKSFAISKGLQNLYVGLGICKKDKLNLIYYGFNFNQHKKLIVNKKLKESDNQLVMVGRLTGFKGHRHAIEAAHYLNKKGIDFKLLIVGSGPLQKELELQITELNLSNKVILKGYQSNGAEYMASSDIVLVPSIAEGFGVVILEAMAVKKPIIAFNVSSLNEHIVNEESGILIEPYDTIKFAEKIEELLNDRKLCQQFTQKATVKLDEYYNLDRMVNETLQFYFSC